jgi:hypothetical protein
MLVSNFKSYFHDASLRFGELQFFHARAGKNWFYPVVLVVLTGVLSIGSLTHPRHPLRPRLRSMQSRGRLHKASWSLLLCSGLNFALAKGCRETALGFAAEGVYRLLRIAIQKQWAKKSLVGCL